jgi:hypothetical protein
MKDRKNLRNNSHLDITHFSRWTPSFSNILTITPPDTPYSFHPSLISTTLGTYLIRIMINFLMMAFQSAETCRRMSSVIALKD